MVGANVSATPAASIFRAVTSHFYYPDDWGSSLTDYMPCMTLTTDAVYLFNFTADRINRRRDGTTQLKQHSKFSKHQGDMLMAN
jgi:hypothetical protein